MKDYTDEELAQAEDELDSLPPWPAIGQPMLGAMMDDYLLMRDGCR